MGKKTNTYVLEVTTTEENQEALENGNFEEVFEVPEDTKVHLEASGGSRPHPHRG